MDIDEVRAIEKENGTPFYLFDEEEFIANYKEFVQTMQLRYANYRLSYSYKTNYTPYVCKLVKELGGYAEVVSGMEYEIARRIGNDADHIIFNGPDKGDDGFSALASGCIVNADHPEEVKAYCEFARKNPEKKLNIGLRVNLDVGQNFISRFGMNAKDIREAVDLSKRTGNLSVTGLHCHISRCRGIEAWRRRTEIMLSLADELFDEPPKYIDLGSGMFGRMDPQLSQQFSNVPSYDDYADVTAKLVAEHYKGIPWDKKPVLFTEPGTTIINKYISCIGKVKAIKQIEKKTFAVLNCSEHNLGETCILKKLPVYVVQCEQNHQPYEGVDFVGYTCLEQDCMYTDYSGELAVGDYIVFGNVGGYSNVYKPPFIKPNCAMIAKKTDGTIRLIKRAETYDDLLSTYEF